MMASLAAPVLAMVLLAASGGGGGVVSAAAAAMLGSDNNATDDMSNATALPPVTDGGVRVIFTLDTLSRARVEVTGDNIALDNESAESLPLTGELIADVRCAPGGAVDGVRLIDANMDFATIDPSCTASCLYNGWAAEVMAVLSPTIRTIAAYMNASNTAIATRSVAEGFADAPPVGSDEQQEAAAIFEAQATAAANWSDLNSTAGSMTFYPMGEVRTWAYDGDLRLSNDAEALGLVFDAVVPMPDAVGASYESGEGTLNDVVVGLAGGAGTAPKSELVLALTEKILIPTNVALRNVDLGLPAAAQQVFETITNGSTIDILLSVEAVGANPCL